LDISHLISCHVPAYRTDDGKSWVLPFIKDLEQKLVSDPNYNHEYLMFLGSEEFNKLAPKLILGDRSPALLEGRVSGYETGSSHSHVL
jgi:aspartate aminotransferase